MNTTTAHPEAESNPQTEAQTQTEAQPRVLSRPHQDRMLAGVAAGLARYLNVDVLIVRIVLAVLAVAGGVGLPLYVAGWLLIPEEGSDVSIATEFIAPRQPGRTE